jgi:hypothetical protein
MKRIRKSLSFVAPSIIIGGLLFFGYYSLYIYKSTGHLACYRSMIAQQTDIAVHVVRQWLGHEGQLYTACSTGNS